MVSLAFVQSIQNRFLYRLNIDQWDFSLSDERQKIELGEMSHQPKTTVTSCVTATLKRGGGFSFEFFACLKVTIVLRYKCSKFQCH